MNVKVGDRIRILKMDDPYALYYPGKEGVVTYIDDMGHLHGTWGGLAVLLDVDEIEVINNQ